MILEQSFHEHCGWGASEMYILNKVGHRINASESVKLKRGGSVRDLNLPGSNAINMYLAPQGNWSCMRGQMTMWLVRHVNHWSNRAVGDDRMSRFEFEDERNCV